MPFASSCSIAAFSTVRQRVAEVTIRAARMSSPPSRTGFANGSIQTSPASKQRRAGPCSRKLRSFSSTPSSARVFTAPPVIWQRHFSTHASTVSRNLESPKSSALAKRRSDSPSHPRIAGSAFTIRSICSGLERRNGSREPPHRAASAIVAQNASHPGWNRAGRAARFASSKSAARRARSISGAGIPKQANRAVAFSNGSRTRRMAERSRRWRSRMSRPPRSSFSSVATASSRSGPCGQPASFKSWLRPMSRSRRAAPVRPAALLR